MMPRPRSIITEPFETKMLTVINNSNIGGMSSIFSNFDFRVVMEKGEGLMSHTASSHQRADKCFGLIFSLSRPPSLFRVDSSKQLPGNRKR